MRPVRRCCAVCCGSNNNAAPKVVRAINKRNNVSRPPQLSARDTHEMINNAKCEMHDGWRAESAEFRVLGGSHHGQPRASQGRGLRMGQCGLEQPVVRVRVVRHAGPGLGWSGSGSGRGGPGVWCLVSGVWCLVSGGTAVSRVLAALAARCCALRAVVWCHSPVTVRHASRILIDAHQAYLNAASSPRAKPPEDGIWYCSTCMACASRRSTD